MDYSKGSLVGASLKMISIDSSPTSTSVLRSLSQSDVSRGDKLCTSQARKGYNSAWGPEAVTDQHLTSAFLYYLPSSYSLDFQTLVWLDGRVANIKLLHIATSSQNKYQNPLPLQSLDSFNSASPKMLRLSGPSPHTGGLLATATPPYASIICTFRH